MYQLTDKVALVVGASKGIGAAIAEELAKCGAKVVLASRNVELTKQVADRLAEAGHEVRAVHADLSDQRSLEQAVAHAVSEFGRLDVAVNNGAESLPSTEFHDVAIGDLDKLMAANLRGVFIAMQYQVRAMLQSGGGSIVNIGSVASLIGVRGRSVYTATKHGLSGLTKSVALEYGSRHIRANVVAPGPIITEKMMTYMSPEGRAEVTASVAMARMGEAHEVATATAWLCSDASSYVTGVTLPVDGGMVAG